MIISICATTGEGKTKTAIEMASIDAKKGRKVIYVSDDVDVFDWAPEMARMIGDEPAKNFRPFYAASFDDLINILPVVDHLPYQTIVLDGYGTDIQNCINNNDKKFKELFKNCLDKTCGKIVYTIQMNPLWEET